MLSTSLRELLEKGALDHQLQTLHANGIGVQRKRADIIMPEIENTFWMKGILSCHSPASLLNTVFYLNGKNFHLRSYQEHATLRFSQIRHFTNPDRYVYHDHLFSYGDPNVTCSTLITYTVHGSLVAVSLLISFDNLIIYSVSFLSYFICFH